MTQEEKQLLLKDLCGRLLYQPKLQIYYKHISSSGVFDDELYEIDIDEQYCNDGRRLEDIKPYLRLMSSMTEEEKVEIQDLQHQNTQEVFKDPSEIRGYRFYDISVVDWLNSHHFDYRGLIEKGLALEAPEGIYK